MEQSKLKNVVDVNNISYDVEREIGEGAQGKIFLLKNGCIVKLYKKRSQQEEMESAIRRIRRYDLDRNYFSVPLKLVTSPAVGYISGFASGMMPLSKLSPESGNEDIMKWYEETGGLVKRYKVLQQLAWLLCKVHHKGLAYCDLSPNNVFVSERADKAAVFIIDLDNLTAKGNIYKNIYTPFYGAPEVVRGVAPNSMAADCFSFAVIAFELLTFAHPLIGLTVEEGEPALEEQALSGQLPWVEDSEDDSNCRDKGLPVEMVMSERLMRLFRRSFEQGLNQPNKRPSMSEWFEVLSQEINGLLRCGECGMTYPEENGGVCPFCESVSLGTVKLDFHTWCDMPSYDKVGNAVRDVYGLDEEVQESVVIDLNTAKAITAGMFLLGDNPFDRIARFKVQEETETHVRIEVEPLSHKIHLRVARSDGNVLDRVFDRKGIIKVQKNPPKGIQTMFFIKDSLMEPQRVITIRYVKH